MLNVEYYKKEEQKKIDMDCSYKPRYKLKGEQLRWFGGIFRRSKLDSLLPISHFNVGGRADITEVIQPGDIYNFP